MRPRSTAAILSYEWTGTANEKKQAGGQIGMLLGLSVVVVFLLLAALYNSRDIPVRPKPTVSDQPLARSADEKADRLHPGTQNWLLNDHQGSQADANAELLERQLAAIRIL